MPVYVRGKERILHLHIPRTGGKSIRRMLKNSGWELEPAEGKKMNGSLSYQHQLVSEWTTWGEFDLTFAVVRDPYARIESEARRNGKLKSDFFMWVKKMIRSKMWKRNTHDGHFIPQHRYLNDEVSILRFEDGFKSVNNSLREKGIIQKYKRAVWAKDADIHTPNLQKEFENSWLEPPAWEDDSKTLQEFNKIYDEDFRLAGYTKK